MHYIGGKPQFAQYKNEIQTFPKLIYRVNAIPTKWPIAFFEELEQKIINLYGNTEDSK